MWVRPGLLGSPDPDLIQAGFGIYVFLVAQHASRSEGSLAMKVG
jgi:hypothetical protein